MNDLVFNVAMDNYMDSYSNRSFKAMFKFSIDQVTYLHQYVDNIPVLDILHFLFFVKTYPTFDMASNITKMCPKMFRNKLMDVCFLLDQQIPQLDFNLRFEEWDYLVPSCIVDGFDCPIKDLRRIPFGTRISWYSHKEGPALRYVTAVHIETGKFLWVSPPYPGATSEISICEDNIIPHLLPGERILADRLFRHSPVFVTAEAFDCELTRYVNSVRSLVERRIGLLKHFRIFDIKYRSINYELHYNLVNLCLRLINLLENVDN